jgi:hypothetical protein
MVGVVVGAVVLVGGGVGVGIAVMVGVLVGVIATVSLSPPQPAARSSTQSNPSPTWWNGRFIV